MLEPFLSGAIALASMVTAMLFWECRTRTRERLFGFFAVAFLLMGIERICTEFISDNPDSVFYLIRLFAFLLILYAILDKNRTETKS
jgi:hypothetical protein